MKWSQVLDKWSKGEGIKYPKNIKKAFIWRTSKLDKLGNLSYNEEFIEDNYLNNIKQDYKPFHEHFKKHKYVTFFPNLSKDTILVVPIPKKGKDFSSMKKFIDNASITQKKQFWKCVHKVVTEMQLKNNYIWISVHGFGVYYFHLRISTNPKYYGSSKLQY